MYGIEGWTGYPAQIPSLQRRPQSNPLPRDCASHRDDREQRLPLSTWWGGGRGVRNAPKALAMPRHAKPSRAEPCPAIPSRAETSRAKPRFPPMPRPDFCPRRALPRQAEPHQAEPCHDLGKPLPRLAMPKPAMPHPATPYHALPRCSGYQSPPSAESQPLVASIVLMKTTSGRARSLLLALPRRALAKPCHALPGRSVLRRATPCHAPISALAMPSLAPPCPTLPGPAAPHHAMSRFTRQP